MTKITRSTLEHTVVVDIFLNSLRNRLVDPNAPTTKTRRPNSSWIRSSFPVRTSNTIEGVTDYGTKRKIIKESEKPQYPYVIVENFNETNEAVSINVDDSVYYRVPCELTIRLTDVGDVTRISNLAGQISNVFYKHKKADYSSKGISNLQWVVVSTPGYASDGNEFNEKQVIVTFDARIDEWEL
jgi:hypothetical protein